MTRRTLPALSGGAAVALMAGIDGGLAANPNVAVARNVRVSASDGTALATDLYFPAQGGAVDFKRSYPTVLLRSPYAHLGPLGDHVALSFCARGYAVAVQDSRGTGRSEGTFEPMRNESWGSHRDGADTAAWLVRQPWSNGKFYAYGGSYLGGTALLLTPMGLPGLTAGFVENAAVNLFNSGWVYRDGLFCQATALFWTGMMASQALRGQPDRLAALSPPPAPSPAAGGENAFQFPDPAVVARLPADVPLNEAPIVKHVPFY
ncbi:CocE/NonD family hydrolase [Methylobacterium nigriterrae]|uniref:CocE/NonD family hydrolase n=1 Tax=Methylobacterium nigriterrae TaxID=3127512 RepID=UPI00301369F4